MSRLDEIAEREKRATPGEWNIDTVMADVIFRTQPASKVHLNSTGAWLVGPDVRSLHKASRDADFVGHARQDVPWMLTNIRTAIAHIDATLTEHAGDIPRGELVRVWDLLEGRAKTTEASDEPRS